MKLRKIEKNFLENGASVKKVGACAMRNFLENYHGEVNLANAGTILRENFPSVDPFSLDRAIELFLGN